MAATVLAEAAQVRELAEKVGANRKDVNGIVDLMAACLSPDLHVSIVAMQCTRELLEMWVAAGDLVDRAALEVTESSDAVNTYRDWLRAKYDTWIDSLAEALVTPTSQDRLRLSVLDAFLHMAELEARASLKAANRAESLGDADGAFGRLCSAMVRLPECEPLLLKRLKTKYLQRLSDVRYHFVQHCGRLAEKLAAAGCRDDEMSRLIDLLIISQPPEEDMSAEDTAFLCFPPGKLPKPAVRLLSARPHRQAFQAAWLQALKLPLTRADMKRVLNRAAERMIPHFPRPLRLAGWILGTFEEGGVLALTALATLYILMQHHGLECPDFFPKLYSLVTADMFDGPHRASFCPLLDHFLSSTLLPAYLTAAFVKRLCRTALVATPPGCRIALTIALNVMIRHPEIHALVHRTNADDRRTDQAGADPFDAGAADPAQCRALESSLWEVATLRHHFVPGVAELADKFALPMTGSRARVTIASFDEALLGMDMAALIRRELGWRRGRPTPLAFRKRKALFRDQEGDDHCLSCFTESDPTKVCPAPSQDLEGQV